MIPDAAIPIVVGIAGLIGFGARSLLFADKRWLRADDAAERYVTKDAATKLYVARDGFDPAQCTLRADCERTHRALNEHFDGMLEERRKSTHELKGDLQRMFVEFGKLQIELARGEERTRGAIALLASKLDIHRPPPSGMDGPG